MIPAEKRAARKSRLTADGLPIDAREWLYDDWRDLHNAIEQFKASIRARHTETKESEDKK